MPAKKNTQNITVRRTGTGPGTGTPDGAAKPAGAAAAVWDALTGSPGTTAAALVTASGASRATVGKTLTALEADGKAIRTKGERSGRQQAPDTWHAVSAGTGQHHDRPGPARPDPGERAAAGPARTDRAGTGPAPAGTAGADPAATEPGDPEADQSDPGETQAVPIEPASAKPGSATTSAEEQAPAAEDHAAAAARAAAIEQATTAAAAIGTVTGSLHAALDAADLGAALIHLDAIRAAVQNARQILKAGSKGRAARTGDALRPGQLRDLVRDHLTAYPSTVLTPYQIGRAIGGRSSGAVANALDKLVEEGLAVLVNDHPRQYRHAEPSAV